MSLSRSCPESSVCVRIWLFRLASFVATPCKWWGLQLYVGRPHQGNDFGHRLAINSSFKAGKIFTCFLEFFWSPLLPSSLKLSLSTGCLWLLRSEPSEPWTIWNAFMLDPERERRLGQNFLGEFFSKLDNLPACCGFHFSWMLSSFLSWAELKEVFRSESPLNTIWKITKGLHPLQNTYLLFGFLLALISFIILLIIVLLLRCSLLVFWQPLRLDQDLPSQLAWGGKLVRLLVKKKGNAKVISQMEVIIEKWWLGEGSWSAS